MTPREGSASLQPAPSAPSLDADRRRRCGAGEPRAGADDVERGTALAHELAGGRAELSVLDRTNGGRETFLESRSIVTPEPRGDDLLRSLEEDVGHLNLVGAGPEARKR